MTIDNEKSLLEDLKQTLTDDFDKCLIQAYAKSFDYDDLERTFREQLTEEAGHHDEN